MIGRRPQPLRPRLASRFAAPSAARFGRRAASLAPLRRALVRRTRPPRPRHPDVVVAPAPPSPSLRLSLVLAPRLAVSLDRRPAAAPPPAGPPSPRAAGVATTRVERLVRRLEHHSTRIERSERVVSAPPPSTGAPGTRAGAGTRVVEAAPRLVLPRAPEAPPMSEPAPPPAARRSEPSGRWEPPDPGVLAEGVLRELDRRIIAERERRGRLA